MKKILSFALYGTNRKYIDKFKANTPSYLKYFYDFDIVLYADIEIKHHIERHCVKYGIKIVFKERLGESDGMFWRFLPIIEQMGDLCLVRDVDYIPNDIELDLVNKFIQSPYEFHIIRAHSEHRMPIMGGLFGIKKSLYKQFKTGYEAWLNAHSMENVVYNDDQLFLGIYVYKWVVRKSLIHTSNVAYLFEKYSVIHTDERYVIGGDQSHKNDLKKIDNFKIFAPVCLLRLLNFRAMRFFSIISYQKNASRPHSSSLSTRRK